MEKINIVENIEKNEMNKYIFLGITPKISRIFMKNQLNKIFIYLNILIIYIILYFHKKSIQKSVNEKYNFLKKYFDEIQKEKNYDLIMNKYKRNSIIWPLPNEIKFVPNMSEIDLIEFSYFMKKENIYFEFGSGGSTNLASYYKLKVYSVESDAKWHNKLKTNGIIANYITIDLNSNYFGFPGNGTKIKDWKLYIQAYKKEYNADIILIDGRFRVACALDIFSKIRNDTLVLIHDYNSRKEYHIIEDYFIKIKDWDNLAVFLKKKDIISIPNNIFNYYLKVKKI